MKKASENWLKIAERDLRAAKSLLKAGDSLNTIFHLHAAVEKILKGIAEEKGNNPPKIHALKKLAVDVCQLKLETHVEILIKSLDKALIDSRYPEDIEIFEEEYDNEYCIQLVKDVEVTFQWLKDLLTKN